MKDFQKKIAIFIDSRKESGGEYQHLLYTLDNIKKKNTDNIEFIIICLSKKLKLNLLLLLLLIRFILLLSFKLLLLLV